MCLVSEIELGRKDGRGGVTRMVGDRDGKNCRSFLNLSFSFLNLSFFLSFFSKFVVLLMDFAN